MTGEKGSNYKLFDSTVKNSHYTLAIDYYKDRQRFYGVHYPDGLDSSAIWKGIGQMIIHFLLFLDTLTVFPFTLVY
jgi:hypothetical protein